jgi:sugar (pentulose or hexulose) kinase
MTIPSNAPFVLGIDVGTSGVRSIAVTATGDVPAESRAPLFDLPAAGAAHEQDANAWWSAVCDTIQELRRTLEIQGRWRHIAGIAVTSTSGSLVLTNALGEPLRPAMLYDDGRAGAVASELNARLGAGETPINASFSLAKALWVRQHEPSVWERAARILHPADWLNARLTGQLGNCDYSNALKLGYDPEKSGWIAAVGMAEIPASMFPRVVAPGDQVGTVSSLASDQTGVAAGVPVLARRLRRPRQPRRFRGKRIRPRQYHVGHHPGLESPDRSQAAIGTGNVLPPPAQ